MALKRWLLLIAIMTGLGMAKVAEQTAVCVKAYELGREQVATHALESETWSLQTDVISLESPTHLAEAIRQTPRGHLVAWSTLADNHSVVGTPSPARTGPARSPVSSPLVRLSQLLGSDD